jgi:hypothetical protein
LHGYSEAEIHKELLYMVELDDIVFDRHKLKAKLSQCQELLMQNLDMLQSSLRDTEATLSHQHEKDAPDDIPPEEVGHQEHLSMHRESSLVELHTI